jgi:hypothetical protein
VSSGDDRWQVLPAVLAGVVAALSAVEAHTVSDNLRAIFIVLLALFTGMAAFPPELFIKKEICVPQKAVLFCMSVVGIPAGDGPDVIPTVTVLTDRLLMCLFFKLLQPLL